MTVILGAAAVLVASVAWFAWDRLSHTPPVRDGSPSWSPDSKRVAFYSEKNAGKGDIFVMNADGSNLTAVVTNPADDGSPAFSPAGRQMAFDSDRDGNFEIYVTNVDKTQLKRLTRNPARDVSPAWSPDGTKIAFMSDRATGKNFDVFMMNADGSNVERVTTVGSAWFPQFSPDGKKLAFHVGRDVNVFDLATHTMHALTQDPDNGMYPSWSPDGLRIAFMSWRNGRTQIFTMKADGTDQRPIVTLASGSAIDPRWSPDGRTIAFVQVPEATPDAPQDNKLPRAIYTVDVASGRVTRLSR
jgi:Tol biopolymer transport system component